MIKLMRRIVLLLSAVSPIVIGETAQAQHVGTCWTPAEPTTSLIASIQDLVTSTDPDDTVLRDSLKLPSVPDSAVYLVQNDSICTAVLQAHVARGSGPSSVTLPYILVIRVGTSRYVVYDGYGSAGEFRLYYVYDDQLEYLGSIAG